MIDEIMEDSAILKAQMRKDGCKDPEATLNGFFEKTGLDLSDVMYRRESSDQLWQFMLTGKTPDNPKGFDYTDAIKAGYCKRYGAKWIAAHTYERGGSGMTYAPYDMNDPRDRLARIRYHGHTLIKRREDLGESDQRLNCLYEIYGPDGTYLVNALTFASAKEYIDSGHNETYL